MPSNGSAGHRQRLRERFLAGEEDSRTEEALLELLLTYAIPQRDVQPLAQRLLAEFGDLRGVLGAEVGALCAVEGVKDSSATLIKLVDWIRTCGGKGGQAQSSRIAKGVEQPSLFDLPATDSAQEPDDVGEVAIEQPSPEQVSTARRVDQDARGARRGTGLFGKAMLKEAIEILPLLPDTESVEEVRRFLRDNLHFSSEQTPS